MSTPELPVMAFDDFLRNPTIGTPTPDAPPVALENIVAIDSARKRSRSAPAPVAKQIFEGLELIFRLAEREEIEAEAIDRFLEAVFPAAMELCPEGERSALVGNIASITGRAKFFKTAAGNVPLPPVAPPPPDPEQPLSESERRFALILRHLQSRGDGSAQPYDASVAQLILLAADIASTRQDLKSLVQKIPVSRGESVFQVLARSIASWDTEGRITASSHPAILAMEKIVSMSGDEIEAARPLRELVMAAVERLNQGQLSAAAAVFALTHRLMSRCSLHASVIERIRTDALRGLDSNALVRHAEDAMNHPMMREALAFFPSLSADELLEQLMHRDRTPARDMARSILVIWGETARERALEGVLREIERESPDIQHLYELFTLLNRIPRTGDDEKRELTILANACRPGLPVAIVTGALELIGGIRKDTAARLLRQRLGEFVAIPYRNDRSFYTTEELYTLLDASVAALAQTKTTAALRAIALHGLRQDRLLGDTRARLRHLADIDLLLDRDTLMLIVDAIRADLPARILGHVVTQRTTSNPTPLIQALRGTSCETVRTLLTEIATNYPLCDFGVAAAKVLREQSRRSRNAHEVDSRTGELAAFGLPRILEKLAAAEATGVLSLADENREIRALLTFDFGRLTLVECGRLRGATALYQLLERPVVGSFAWVARKVTVPSADASEVDVRAAVEEGLRRHDELQLFSALVPDDASFKATGGRPTRSPEETDPHLLREAWLCASSGTPVASWEASINADSWRVRRVVARWLADGSLEPAVR